MPYGPFQGWTKLNTGTVIGPPGGFLDTWGVPSRKNTYTIPRRATTWVLPKAPDRGTTFTVSKS